MGDPFRWLEMPRWPLMWRRLFIATLPISGPLWLIAYLATGIALCVAVLVGCVCILAYCLAVELAEMWSKP